MSRIFLYGLLFLVLIGIETGFLTALPFPLRTIPLVPILGIWFYHQMPSRIGLWYLLIWGIWYDLFALSLWSSKTVIALAMILVLIYASGRVFSRHSLYGLLGLALSVWIVWSLVEALFRFLSPSALELAFHGFMESQLFMLAGLLIGISLLFMLSLRVREHLRML